jgi:hypothetical protein
MEAKNLVDRVIKSSGKAIGRLVRFARDLEIPSREVALYTIEKGKRKKVNLRSDQFLLRTSMEYCNPQVTIEEATGTILAGIMAGIADHCLAGKKEPSNIDSGAVLEHMGSTRLEDRTVVPFFMMVDDIEPDRFSMNPLRASLYETMQTALPVAYVENKGLEVDPDFVKKYRDKLVTEEEAGKLDKCLEKFGSLKWYTDLVDIFKYDQLGELSGTVGMDLKIPFMRMPLETLQKEGSDGTLHSTIRRCYEDDEILRGIYQVLSKPLSNYLLTVPLLGNLGSKRVAKGKIEERDGKIVGIKVSNLKRMRLSPNEIDRKDVSYAICCDKKIRKKIGIEDLKKFEYAKMPLSPQFAIYMIQSPENGAFWHGMGGYQSTALVGSYVAMNHQFDRFFKGLPKPHPGVPVQFDINGLLNNAFINSIPHKNVDASLGCVSDGKLEKILLAGLKCRIVDTKKFTDQFGKV